MPTIVAHRRSPTANPWIGSCAGATCRTATDGLKTPAIAGLPGGLHPGAASRLQNGARRIADQGKRNTATMAGNAGGLTDEEAIERQNISPPEDDPVDQGGRDRNRAEVPQRGRFLLCPAEGNETVPMGDQILEMPVNLDETELHAQGLPGLPTSPSAALNEAKTWSLEAERERPSRAPLATARI